MIARTLRMLGYRVHFPFGVDRNGIPVELYVERELKVSMRDVQREQFLELCTKALDELESDMLKLLQRVGFSAELERCYRTDSPTYRALTQTTFIKLWRAGLIYEASRPNNWCPKLQTTLAEAEVVYKELPSQLAYIKFEVEPEVVVATTRPELLCACQALIVHPADERYSTLQGKKARVPLYGTQVPIIPHPAARPEFGTGIAMVCSYGDYTDVRLFRELKLKEVVAIDEQGRLTQIAGKYAGLSVEEARQRVLEDLRAQGALLKVEPILHRVPVAERSGHPIEIIPMKEWYLKQLDFKERIKRMLKRAKFYPERHRQLLLNWLDSLSIDWPISRRRYYGTEIPIWYCKHCKKPHLPKAGKYWKPWKQAAPFKACKHCGCKEFVPELRTFDTWFDSSLTPLFIAGWPGKRFRKLYSFVLRPQGYEIVRTWLYYSMLRCLQLTGRLPFKAVWIAGLGMDERGEKMSKSKGNIIYPWPLLQRYGADACRFWCASEVSLGYDFRCSEQRIQAAYNFLTKFWNVSRFISQFPLVERTKLKPLDRWILAELNELIRRCLQGYMQLNFYIPSNQVREWVWNLFAPHYLELVKPRAYGSMGKQAQRAAWYAMHACLRTLLVLLAPIVPFLSDCVWRKLYKGSVHTQHFPKPKSRSKLVKLTQRLCAFNSVVWKAKKEAGLSLKDSISVSIPSELKRFELDLRAAHHLL